MNKKIINGLLAILLASGILLLSDLSNHKSFKKTKQKTNKTLFAEKGYQYKLGVTAFTTEAVLDTVLDGLWQGLSELGFRKDSNLEVIFQHANGEMTNLHPIHQNMDNMDLDAILVTSTPGITAAISAVENHPMVFTMSYTPLEAGAGKSYTNHLPNITGIGSFPPVEKTIDCIKDLIPNTKRIGTIYNASEANSSKVIKEGTKYAKNKGIEIVASTVTSTSEVYQAILSVCQRNVDAIWITGDNTSFQAIDAIINVCIENKIPLFLNDVDYLNKGAVAAIGIGWKETGYRTAKPLAMVLNGEPPGNIPIENFVKEKIAMNTEIAKSYDISIPKKYLKKENPLKGKNLKFCLVHYVDSPNSENAEEGIRGELNSMGLVENEDFDLKVYNAQGDISTLNSIAEAIISDNFDLIFTSSTPTIQVISKKVDNVPIVFTNVGDPIKAGLGESFENHAPNITGVSTMSDFEGLLDLVIESIPNIKTIGTIYTPAEVNSVAYNERLTNAASKKNLEVISVPANSSSELMDATKALVSQDIDAITQISDNLTAAGGTAIIKVAYDSKVPYFGFITKQVDQGAIAAVARDYYTAGVDAAKMAQMILLGKSPLDIPFQFVSGSNVKVNTEAMEYFEVKVPAKYSKQSIKAKK